MNSCFRDSPWKRRQCGLIFCRNAKVCDNLHTMIRKNATMWFLLVVAAAALYLCYIIAEPFLNPIFAAIVLAIVFYPLHARMQALIRRPNLAAILSTILVMIIVAVPAVFLGAAVTGELGGLYQSLSQKSAAEGGLSHYLMQLLEKPLALAGDIPSRRSSPIRSAPGVLPGCCGALFFP